MTDHQKNIYEAYHGEDYSLGELAAEYGISRQGVHDLIKRTDQALEKYEEKLHLVERFLIARDQAEEIRKIAQSMSLDRTVFAEGGDGADRMRLERIIELTERLMEEL